MSIKKKSTKVKKMDGTKTIIKEPKRRETDKNSLKLSKSTSRIFMTIVSILFITTGTILAIYFVLGYKITLNGVGEKTGVISVNSSPAFSYVYLDNESIGRTPQTEALISQGIHNIRIEKKGYITWNKNIQVVEGKSTPIFVPLFMKDPEAETVLKGENKIIEVFNDTQHENIFIMTSKDVNTDIKQQETELITIQKYRTQTLFWQNSNNPTLLFEQELLKDNIPTISSSFDGKYLLLEFPYKEPITTDETLEVFEEEIDQSQIEPIIGTYILNTSTTSAELTEIPNSLQSVATDYKWSEDNTLLVTTENVLISLEIPEFKQEILLTGDLSTIIYSIDKRGDLYYLGHTESNTTNGKREPAYYSIIQSSRTGKDTEAIGQIYYNETDEYLKSDIGAELQTPFSNSPENYRFAGEIKSFIIDIKAKSVIIQTEFALYHYNLKTEKYTVISTDLAEFISFAPDFTRLLYKNEIGIGLFTFDKEEADYISTLGSQILLAKDSDNKIQNIVWHKSSEIFVYQDQTGTNIIDLDSAYNHLLTPHTGFSMTEVDAEILYTLETSEDSNAFSLNMFVLR